MSKETGSQNATDTKSAADKRDKTDEVTNPKDSADSAKPDKTDQKEPDVHAIMEEIKSENNDLKDKILRIAAENQNTRKRLVKQQQDAYKYRHQDILRDLTDVIDNFERAIDSSADSKDFETFYEGIVMIEKQFSGMLVVNYGLEKIGNEGEPFDPVAHEAVSLEESEEVDAQVIKQVFQPGYRLHDRILRSAKVLVVKPSESKVQDGKISG